MIEKALKTIIQTLHSMGLFEADEVIKDCLLIEVNGRPRPNLEKLIADKVIQFGFVIKSN